MAFALAALKVVVVAGAVLLVGLGPARTAEASSITLTADAYVVDICSDVVLTSVLEVDDRYSATTSIYIHDITESGSKTKIYSAGFFSPSPESPTSTASHTVNHCLAGTHTYQAWRALNGHLTTGSSAIVVHWLGVSERGEGRPNVIPNGGTYTNTKPIIISLDYDKPEAVTTNPGATTYDGGVHLQWTPVEHAGSYLIDVVTPTGETQTETTVSETAATASSLSFTDIFPNQELRVPFTFRVQAKLHNDHGSAAILDTASGIVLVSPYDLVYSPSSEEAIVIIKREGSDPPIDRTSAGASVIVEPGAAPEGITAVARLIAEQTGMGTGAATTLLPLLCLLLAGGAAAVVVLPLGFSPLSLAAGFRVFTLVWSVGGVAWFGLPIAVAALPPVLLAASGVMIVRRRGMFG